MGEAKTQVTPGLGSKNSLNYGQNASRRLLATERFRPTTYGEQNVPMTFGGSLSAGSSIRYMAPKTRSLGLEESIRIAASAVNRLIEEKRETRSDHSAFQRPKQCIAPTIGGFGGLPRRERAPRAYWYATVSKGLILELGGVGSSERKGQQLYELSATKVCGEEEEAVGGIFAGRVIELRLNRIRFALKELRYSRGIIKEMGACQKSPQA